MSVDNAEYVGACQDPNCVMQIGNVVRVRPGYRSARESTKRSARGLVEWSHGQGDSFARMQAATLAVNDAIIDMPGLTRVTNIHGEWEGVPEEERTSVERLKSVALTWQPPDWRDPDDQDYEPDSFVFALIRALLTPPERDRVFNDRDWPTSTYELILQVGEAIDERVAGSRTLGAALARIGPTDTGS